MLSNLVLHAGLFLSVLAIRPIIPIEDFVKDLGHRIERHTIQTADGYLLTYHRLPGRGRPGTPVLFVNGLNLSSASIMAKGSGLVYSMVEAGLDVWMANYRGNMYSRRHVTLDPDRDKAFWNYTLHELGSQDLPAGIDYVLSHTGRQQLIYIGYSMGTTAFWIMGSTRPHYLDKVIAMIAIAPVARPCNCIFFNNWSRFKVVHGAASALWAMNMSEFLPYGETTSAVVTNVCNQTTIAPACRSFIGLYNSIRSQGVEVDTSLKLIKYTPAGVSIKVILHYMQIAKAGRFQQFDYEGPGNKILYNAENPPAYDLSPLVLPIYFIYSDQDEIATTQDIQWLSAQLPRPPVRILSPAVNQFKHLDFNFHRDLAPLMSDPLTVFIRRLADRTTYQQLHTNYV